jgi:hypothetical protein
MVATDVVWFFLFKRTSSPILTFKNLCDDYPVMGLSQVLPRFEPLDSGSITFFQIQKPLDSTFELGLVHVHTTFSPILNYVSTKFYDKLN